MKGLLLQLGAFAFVLAIHFTYIAYGFYNSFGKYESLSLNTYIYSYKNAQQLFVGLSLGLLAFFAVYSIRKYLETRDSRSVRTGTVLFFVLLIASYLLLGINNSTGMFDYFVNNLGYFYLAGQYLFLFPAVALSFIISIIVVFFTSRRVAKKITDTT